MANAYSEVTVTVMPVGYSVWDNDSALEKLSDHAFWDD